MPINRTNVGGFLKFLRQFVPLTDVEVKREFLPIIQVREFRKKQVITQSGDVENYMSFISEGLVRKYYKILDEEYTVQISKEGHLISCQESFYTRQPSECILETIEPSTLLSIAYDDLDKLFSSSHHFEKLGRLVTVYVMVLKDKWQNSLIMQSPRERFLNFMENYPEVLQRVPQKYLASYLNIRPETFSRFKHLLRVKKTSV